MATNHSEVNRGERRCSTLSLARRGSACVKTTQEDNTLAFQQTLQKQVRLNTSSWVVEGNHRDHFYCVRKGWRSFNEQFEVGTAYSLCKYASSNSQAAIMAFKI